MALFQGQGSAGRVRAWRVAQTKANPLLDTSGFNQTTLRLAALVRHDLKIYETIPDMFSIYDTPSQQPPEHVISGHFFGARSSRHQMSRIRRRCQFLAHGCRDLPSLMLVSSEEVVFFVFRQGCCLKSLMYVQYVCEQVDRCS